MKCRVCGKEVVFYQNIERMRAEGGNLCRSNKFTIKTKRVYMYVCMSCGHVQIPYLLDDNYYENYDDVSGFKQYYSGLNKIEKKISKLRDYCKIDGQLLEVGCGGGYALEIANKYFSGTLGVDPSRKECEIAKNNGLNVICGEFDKRLKINEKVAAISTFQTFEHLEKLNEIINYMWEVLEDDGVALINVPNGEQILKNGLYHQLLLEHINYFSTQSIITLVKNAGFEVLDMDLDIETIEIDLDIKKRKNTKFESVSMGIEKKLNDILTQYNNIGIYGAGAKSAYYSSIIHDSNKSKILHVFDTDVDKKGKYISGIDKSIELISNENINFCEIVIIFASSYNREIIKRLRDTGYNKEIIIFEQEEIKLISD